MPFNVLLLPLLGGYLFITHFNRTRFHARRHSGERLIFHSAIAGILLLAVSFLLVRTIDWMQPALQDSWRAVVPFPYTGTSFGAFALGGISPWALNRLQWLLTRFPRLERVKKLREFCEWNLYDNARSSAIEVWGNYFEILLESALHEYQLVSITLRSGKVYVGWITYNFDPAFERKFVIIHPMLSGYRDSQDHTVVFTTNYARVYDRLEADEDTLGAVPLEDFGVVIPVGEVVSANLFDPDVYEVFEAAQVDETEMSSQ